MVFLTRTHVPSGNKNLEVALSQEDQLSASIPELHCSLQQCPTLQFLRRLKQGTYPRQKPSGLGIDARETGSISNGENLRIFSDQ